jgi:hypothetical protein
LNDLGHVDSLSELGQVAGAQLEYALHPNALYIWYRDGSTFSLGYSSTPEPVPPAATPDPTHLTIPMTDNDGRLAGMLMLAEKKSEEPYTGSDRQLLHAIARQIGVVRENLRLKALVGQEQRIRHEVLARLDGHVSVLRECPTCGACFDGSVDRCDADGAALTLSLPVERTINGRYRLDHLIGRGGMGTVYEALDLQLGRPVAVKIMVGPSVGRRRIVHVNVTDHPTVTWTAQQVVDAFPEDTAPRWLHRDRDSIYGDVFQRRLASLGISEIVSAPASPWQNPYVQRLIGSIRRECLDHVIVLNEAHLRRVLKAYSRYYIAAERISALRKTPDHRPVSGASAGPIVAISEVGGLHHRYERRAA